MTELDVNKLWFSLVATWPKSVLLVADEKTCAVGTAGVYQDALRNLDGGTAARAVASLRNTHKFPQMPSIAEIREVAVELERGPVRSGGDAWGDVDRAMRKYGHVRTPGVGFHFEDPIVAKCVSALNWQALCSSENSIADRSQFVRMYEQEAAQGHREAVSPVLAAAREERRGAIGVGGAIANVLRLVTGGES